MLGPGSRRRCRRTAASFSVRLTARIESIQGWRKRALPSPPQDTWDTHVGRVGE